MTPFECQIIGIKNISIKHTTDLEKLIYKGQKKSENSMRLPW